MDALRLMAVFLSHWDNKAPNQRLLCPPGRELSRGGCAAPIAMIQDLGATFGPLSVDLPNWRTTPIWHDRAACIVSMRTLPYRGATFSDVRISDAGRRMIAGLLDQLSTAQLEDLFTASGIIQYDAIDGHARAAAGWVGSVSRQGSPDRGRGAVPAVEKMSNGEFNAPRPARTAAAACA